VSDHRTDGIRQGFPPVKPPTPDIISKCAKVVAGNSDNVDEALMFLDMLGIDPKEVQR
jgi:hypothetical protein